MTPVSQVEWPLVSMIVPCRNEASTIDACLESLAANDYPADRLEVLVVDGGSTDGTLEILSRRQIRHPQLKVLDNPRHTVQHALNIGIAAAAGDLIARTDAHSRIGPSHIRECVRHLREFEADSVGGRIVTLPRRSTAMGRAIAVAMSERFGVGGSRFRLISSESAVPQFVDNVPFPCYRRDVFERIGRFNESMDRSEDVEFHQRMRQAGCRTLFVPSIVSQYYARSDYRSFAAHAVDNGRWAVLPVWYTRRLAVGVRHLIPMAFVAVLVVLATLASGFSLAARALIALVSLYAAIAIGVSWLAAVRERSASLAVLLPVVFATLHLGYGVGSWLAVCRIAAGLGRPPRTAQTSASL